MPAIKANKGVDLHASGKPLQVTVRVDRETQQRWRLNLEETGLSAECLLVACLDRFESDPKVQALKESHRTWKRARENF